MGIALPERGVTIFTYGAVASGRFPRIGSAIFNSSKLTSKLRDVL